MRWLKNLFDIVLYTLTLRKRMIMIIFNAVCGKLVDRVEKKEKLRKKIDIVGLRSIKTMDQECMINQSSNSPLGEREQVKEYDDENLRQFPTANAQVESK